MLTPSLVNIYTLPFSDVFPTLISEVGDYSNLSASANLMDSCGNCSDVTYLPLQAPPLATPTFLSDLLDIGWPNLARSCLLR